MSMLADRKRKQKWSLNPRGNLWSQDGNKFGQKMLEKMGWSQGKGLGANLNGITEHVRVMHKSDTSGIGFKDTEGWTQHESKFSKLLENLAANSGKTENSVDDNKPAKLTSLEKTSEKSRKRVHYHKFTRGKDLSRCSEKDLASIFGKKSLTKAPKDVEVEEEKPAKDDHDYGVETHNAGSMLDYFTKKLKKFNKKNGEKTVQVSVDVNDSESESEINRGFGFGFKPTESPKHAKSSEDSGLCNPAFDPLHGSIRRMRKHTLTTIAEDQSENDNTLNCSGVSFSSAVSQPECVNEVVQAAESSKKKKKKKVQEAAFLGIDNPSLDPNCAEEGNSGNSDDSKLDGKRKKKKNEINVENDDYENTKDSKKKKRKNKERGIENLACQESDLSISGVDILPTDTFDSGKAGSVEEAPKVSKKEKKKRKEKFEGIDNPCLNLDLSNEVDKEDATEVVGSQEVKMVKKRRRADVEMESPETCEAVEETAHGKRKKKRSNNVNEGDLSCVGGLDNPSFNFNNSGEVENSVSECQKEESKKQKKRKNGKKKENESVSDINISSASGIDNPTFNFNNSAENENIVSESEKDVSRKEKKRKKRKSTEECGGIDNPCLNLNASAEHADSSGITESFEVKRRKKDRRSEEQTKTENVSSECDTSITCDLMLNVCAVPVPEKKEKSKPNRQTAVQRRRSVRFCPTNEERIIPSDPDKPLITPNKSHDNRSFDLRTNMIEENVNSMAQTIDQLEAEVENDLNEAKWDKMAHAEFMVGETGNPNGADELLATGETKLKLKHALFGRSPSWLSNRTPDSYAKKSYKHLIKGDIILGFNHSNLHEIKGYANHL